MLLGFLWRKTQALVSDTVIHWHVNVNSRQLTSQHSWFRVPKSRMDINTQELRGVARTAESGSPEVWVVHDNMLYVPPARIRIHIFLSSLPGLGLRMTYDSRTGLCTEVVA